MGKFDDTVVLICGALHPANAIAEIICAEGGTVIVNDPDSKLLEQITAPVTEKTSHDYSMEFIDEIAHLKVIDEVIAKHGKINSLIINIDDYKIAKNRVDSYTPEDYDAIMEANVNPVFHLLAGIREHYREKQGTGEQATVLMMSSIVGKAGLSAGTLYAAAKGAVNGMTRSLAKEFGRFANVNAIAQGFYSVKKGAYGPRDRAKGGFMITKTARSDENLMPEDVARVAAYLASKEAKMISGQIYSVDGGLWLNVES